MNMSEHHAKIYWERKSPDFVYETYDRSHKVTFGGGLSLLASAAPDFKGRPDQVNPEEMLAASAASCHMLTFLAVAAKSRLVVNSYEDQATAILEQKEGLWVVTKIILKPKVVFENPTPSVEKLESLHQKAHKNCIIANSIQSQIVWETR